MTKDDAAAGASPAAPSASPAAPAANAETQKWTVRAMLAWSRDWLAKKGIDNPRLDAELLLAHALQVARIKLYIDHDKPLQADELARFKALILRRAEREPVAYLLGSKEFYGRAFAVDKRAFIPRPETELLVQAVLAALPQEGVGGWALGVGNGPDRASGAEGGALRVLDLCAGSGAIGVTIAAERPDVLVDLVELSPETADVTLANAETHAKGRARVLIGDLFAPLEAGTRYAAIASNPPYIKRTEEKTLAPEIARHEPKLALYSGEDGLDAIRKIIAQAGDWLVPGGTLAIELDPPQAEVAIALCNASGFVGAHVERDLAGLLRTLIAKAPPGAVGSNRDEPRDSS